MVSTNHLNEISRLSSINWRPKSISGLSLELLDGAHFWEKITWSHGSDLTSGYIMISLVDPGFFSGIIYSPLIPSGTSKHRTPCHLVEQKFSSDNCHYTSEGHSCSGRSRYWGALLGYASSWLSPNPRMDSVPMGNCVVLGDISRANLPPELRLARP